MSILGETVQDNTMAVEDKKIDLRKYMGKGEKLFQTDAQDYIKKMRENERIEN